MANYIEIFNSKLDWAMPFQRTGKFPLDRSSMFDTYTDAVAYAKGDGSDSRGLGGTSYVGQLLVVFENDVVTLYKINADRTIEALTSKSGVDADILDLQTQLTAEIAARKAVDGQSGQTYAKNTAYTHISAATSLNNADILLNNALTAEIAARKAVDGQSGQTYAKNTSATYISGATSLNNADVLLSNAIGNLKLTAVTGTELSNLGANIKEAYKFIDGNNTQHGSYIKIYKDTALKTVTFSDQTLYFTYILTDGTEETVPVDVSAFLTENEYADGLQVTDHIISVKRDTSSESFLTVGIDGIKLSGVQNAINTAINNLDAAYSQSISVDANGKASSNHIGFELYQQDGKITSFKIDELDIASAYDLSEEVKARKAVDGQSGQTYAKNTAYTHISAATSLNNADILLNNAITAETKARQDAINALDATVSGNGTHVDVTVVQTNGKVSSVSVAESDIASASALTAEIAARKAVDGQSGQTYVRNSGYTHISAATSLNNADILLNNALTAEIAARKAVDGQSGQTYAKNTSATYISGATSLNNADVLLDAAIKAANTRIDNLDSTVSGNGTHVDVTVVQTNGKVSSVSVAESDIASASALTALNNWCAFMSGHTTTSSLTSVPTTKRMCIATISSSQTLGISGSIDDGREVHIFVKNTSTSNITITIPSTINSKTCVNMVGENLIIYGSSYGEINLAYDGSTYYYRGA